jgi:hypothetical protein
MELSPSWGANSWATQEILSILWNMKVQRRVHKSPSLIPILGQMCTLHTVLPSHFSKIHFKIILIRSCRAIPIVIHTDP